MLYRVSKKLPPNSLQLLYNTLITSQINYCCSIWGCAAETHLDQILKLQKKAIRIISNSNYNAHTRGLFFKYNKLNIYDINKIQTAKLMHQLINSNNNLTMKNFCSILNIKKRTRIHLTRDSELNMQIPFCRTELKKKDIEYRGTVLWNSLPSNIKNIASLQPFIKAYKEYLLNYYSFPK